MDMRMKRLGSHIKRVFSGGESGFAFIAVLTFLILGAIIIAPLLGFMITGLRAQQSHESRTTELYSADAGVEYAIWRLQNELLGDGTVIWPVDLEDFEINGDNVTVKIEYDDGVFFRIISEATDIATGSKTTVRAWVTAKYGYAENFFANGVTALGNVSVTAEVNGNVESTGTVDVSPEGVINGDVRCDTLVLAGIVNGNVHCREINMKNTGLIFGNIDYWVSTGKELTPLNVTGYFHVSPPPDLTDLTDVWPKVDYLNSYYLAQVPTVNYDYTEVTWCPATLGPLYTGYDAKGDPRDLYIKTGMPTCFVRLEGTIFVTGDFEVTANSALDLNGQTIYCQGEVKIYPGAILTGTGLIIAVGAVDFQPTIATGGESAQAAIVRYNGLVWATQFSPTAADLNDIWGASGTQLFAVGEGGTVLVTSNGGASWTSMASGTANDLNGVWGTADNDILAVGEGGTILHYDGVDDNADGSLWDSMDSGTSAALNDIWGSASDNVVYAAGGGGTILQYKEGDWSAVENGVAQNLNGVWGSSSSDVYAVGAGGTILHYDGTTWEPMTSITTLGLNDVWGNSPSDVFFVGDGGTIVRYQGGSWSSMTIDTGITPDIMGIWGTASNNIFAVGRQGAIIRYQGLGSVWTRMMSATTKDLNAVWGSSATNVFAVGKNESDFIFIQSLTNTVLLLPNGEFHGSVAGYIDKDSQNAVSVKKPGSLMAPEDLGGVNFPSYRWIDIVSYTIEQH
jgi:hypothetical protein